MEQRPKEMKEQFMQLFWDKKRVMPTSAKPQAETFGWPKKFRRSPWLKDHECWEEQKETVRG